MKQDLPGAKSPLGDRNLDPGEVRGRQAPEERQVMREKGVEAHEAANR
ncbi:MAG: hypothetical protein V4583_11590 [Pseudomonadota bacterium]